MVIYVIMGIGTVLLIFWIFLLLSVTVTDIQASAYAKIVTSQKNIEKLQRKGRENEAKLDRYDGILYFVMSQFWISDYSKKISSIQRKMQNLLHSRFSGVSIIPTCGHVLVRKSNNIRSSQFYRTMLTNFSELNGRKHACQLCDHLMASVISTVLLGVGLIFVFASIKFAARDARMGITLLTVGSCLVFLLAYAFCNEVTSSVRLRRESILRQFPNIVSKLALLVTSGIIMERAWKETAESGEGELYDEMKKTALELENLVAPLTAYGEFINRCQTKETSKLASAIMQNTTKGNTEIGNVLQEMAADAWVERRHLAKRDSEAANAKMMIPTFMLFLTILCLIMVPIAMNFSF